MSPRLLFAATVVLCVSLFGAVASAQVAGATVTRPAAVSLRPPLTGDPMSYSQQELRRANYPIRPDPVATPTAYARWLKLVTQPASVAMGGTVTESSVFHSAGPNSYNWAGGILDNPNTPPLQTSGPPYQPYGLAWGEWVVPDVTGVWPAQNSPAHVAHWVGIDNVAQQAGTDVVVTNVGDLTLTLSYSLWFEWPHVQVERNNRWGSDPSHNYAFPTFQISANDLVGTEFYIGDVNGGFVPPNTYGAAGTYLWYYFWDVNGPNGQQINSGWQSFNYASNGGQFQNTSCSTSTCPMAGNFAEAIIERPTEGLPDGGSYLAGLAYFGTGVQIPESGSFNFVTMDSSGYWWTITPSNVMTSTVQFVSMYSGSGGHPLASCGADPTNLIICNWEAMY